MKEFVYFKDDSTINQRTKQKENFEKLVQLIEQGDYEKFLFPEELREVYPHKDKHIACDFKKSDDYEHFTEKRICRCFCYYNKGIHKSKCSECQFVFKKKNVGKIEILDYESPTIFNSKSVGGIDWIIYDGEYKLATEVKPPDSSETLVRMVSEILTYNIGKEDTRPAICFFKNTSDNTKISKQCSDYLKYKESETFKSIVEKTHLKVLYVTFDNDTFEIHDTEKEPL